MARVQVKDLPLLKDLSDDNIRGIYGGRGTGFSKKDWTPDKSRMERAYGTPGNFRFSFFAVPKDKSSWHAQNVIAINKGIVAAANWFSSW